MATSAPTPTNLDLDRTELDRLGDDLFHLAKSQLAKMAQDDRASVIASIHATAEGLRAINTRNGLTSLVCQVLVSLLDCHCVRRP
jgi:hypothetical protein